MGVYKQQLLEEQDRRNGTPRGKPEEPIQALATKLAWAVGSTLKQPYGAGSPLKLWGRTLAERIIRRNEERRSSSGVPVPR